ncbi:MAG: c-type cytochrome [Anaerolineales bacterium]
MLINRGVNLKTHYAKRFFALVLILLVGALSMAGCSFNLAGDVTPPPGAEQVSLIRTPPSETGANIYPLVPPDPFNGKQIYLEKCAPCHGVNGDGDGPRAAQLSNAVPALASVEVARQATPASWFGIVTRGNLEHFMPPFPSLSDSQRWDVVAYALSLSTSLKNTQEGENLYRLYCVDCHGETGKGDGQKASSLSKPPRNLTDLAFSASKSAVDLYGSIVMGVQPAMPPFGEKLSEEQRWAIVDYLRSLTFTAPIEKLSAATPQAAEVSPSLEQTQIVITPTPVPTPESTITSTTPSESSIGSISGKVINGSGGSVPKDLLIMLQGLDDMETVITATTPIRADDTFYFPNVEMVKGRVFIAMTQYDGTTYASDVNVAPPNGGALDMPITIYETTTDASVIKADRLHLFFDFEDENTIRVVELYIMSNTSNKTLVPPPGQNITVRFKLPVGSSNLEFQDSVLGDRYVETPDGFGDTYSIRPGRGNYQILFSFTMPYNNRLDLVQPLLIPVDAVVALVPEGVLKVRSSMLKDDGRRDEQGIIYHLYSGAGMAPGSEIRLTLTGKYGGNGFSILGSSRRGFIVGLIFFGIGLIVAGLWFYRHTRLVELDEEEAQAIASPETAESIMDAIIALDDLFQSGGIPQEAYRERRMELKEKLKNLRQKKE